MKHVFSAAGLRSLRASWVMLGLAIVACASLVAASHWYVEREGRERALAVKRLEDAKVRLQAAQRERDSLQESAEVFRSLVDRGLLEAESRLDLVEMITALRARHQLFGLDYDIAPQRPLQLPGGRTFGAVDVLASRVKLRMRALHEGDVLGFVEALSTNPQGFYPIDRCTLRRVDGPSPEALAPRVEADCAFEWITLKEKNANRPG